MTKQFQSPAVVKFNIYSIKGLKKGLYFEIMDYTKELKTVACTSFLGLDSFGNYLSFNQAPVT